MTPLDFITEAAEGQYNTPAGHIHDALQEDIKIYSGAGKRWRVLSYYYSKQDQCMILDIEKV